jgi:hypothetical protein
MEPNLDGNWGDVPGIVRITMKPVRVSQREKGLDDVGEAET